MPNCQLPVSVIDLNLRPPGSIFATVLSDEIGPDLVAGSTKIFPYPRPRNIPTLSISLAIMASTSPTDFSAPGMPARRDTRCLSIQPQRNPKPQPEALLAPSSSRSFQVPRKSPEVGEPSDLRQSRQPIRSNTGVFFFYRWHRTQTPRPQARQQARSHSTTRVEPSSSEVNMECIILESTFG